MIYTPLITPAAAVDIVNAVQYYEQQLEGLGSRFSTEMTDAVGRICTLPFSFSIRYRNVRGVKLKSFPYLLLFQINDKTATVSILRVYSTYQKPLWK